MMPASLQLKRLISVASERSPAARRALLRDITGIFLSAPQRFHASEIRHFDAIMTSLVRHADGPLRREVAEKFADLANAPSGFINQLARGDIAAAEPLLRRSPALGDSSLIAIIGQCSEAHKNAIARRRTLSEDVTQALAEHGGEDALTWLAKNQGAQFSADTMQALTHKARQTPSLQGPMIARFDLPPPFLTQLFFFVPGPLKKEILARAAMLDPSLIDAAETANRHKLYSQAQSGADLSEARRFIAEKITARAINESLLTALVKERRQTEFLYAFAYVTGVDLASAQAIMKDNRYEALALACRAAGLEHQTFARIVLSLRKDDDQSKALRILDLYGKISQDSAERVMRFWRMRTGAAAEASRPHLEADNQPLELRDRAKGW